MPHEFNVLALIKGNERYIFVYDDESRQDLVNTFRDQASDPNLSLTWFDAIVLTNKAKEQLVTSTPATLAGPHFDLQTRSRIEE